MVGHLDLLEVTKNSCQFGNRRNCCKVAFFVDTCISDILKYPVKSQVISIEMQESTLLMIPQMLQQILLLLLLLAHAYNRVCVCVCVMHLVCCYVCGCTTKCLKTVNITAKNEAEANISSGKSHHP